MPSGQMATDTTYPSATGIPCGGSAIGSSFQYPRVTASLTITKTPGGSPTYDLQAEVGDDTDSSATRWVTVATLTGTGHTSVTVCAKSIRLNAANGSSPGTGNNTPRYNLNVCPDPNSTRVGTR